MLKDTVVKPHDEVNNSILISNGQYWELLRYMITNILRDACIYLTKFIEVSLRIIRFKTNPGYITIGRIKIITLYVLLKCFEPTFVLKLIAFWYPNDYLQPITRWGGEKHIYIRALHEPISLLELYLLIRVLIKVKDAKP